MKLHMKTIDVLRMFYGYQTPKFYQFDGVSINTLYISSKCAITMGVKGIIGESNCLFS